MFILLVLFPLSLFGQVTSVPELPTETGIVTLKFDATQGNAGLKDYTGDVYAHIGVITDKSTSNSDWKYVVAGWTVNLPKAKLTRTATNLYELTISPSLRDFFAVPDGEKIKKIAMVFRSGDQTNEGKGVGNTDIFVDVYESGVNVKINTPSTSPYIASTSESVNISVSASNNQTIKLYVNNNEVSSANATSLQYTLPAQLAGKYKIKAVAANGASLASDSVLILVPSVVTEEARPAGVPAGISYPSTNSATVVLFAPKKQYVYLLGDFNNWEPDNDWMMKKDGDYYWFTINNLTANKAYLFQYLVDGKIKIADPYTSVIADPSNDKYITDIVYPNLPVYPIGKTTGIASVLQPGASSYTWKSTSFTAPSKDKLVVYEMHVRDFTTEGTIKAAATKLDYLQKLGINAVELMPVNEFEGNDSWGYNPSFYFAFDKAYGTANDYKAFVDECHKRGIAVVQDLVLNHSYSQSPFVQLYFDGSKPSVDNPWYNVNNNFQNPDAQWGYDFNHDSKYTRALVDSVASYWMSEYKVDGFRYDFTKGFSNTSYGPTSWGSDYDAARISNLKRMSTEVWKRNPNAYVIFEHLSDNVEEQELASAGIMLWGNMNWAYSQNLQGYANNADISWINYRQRGWDAPRLVGYMESHDEERTMFRAINSGASAGNYNVKYLATALNRAKALSALFLMVPGPKMIWQFGELGYDVSIDNGGRLGRKPVKWDYYDNAQRKDLYTQYAMLNYLRNQSNTFADGKVSGSLSGLTKVLQVTHNDMNVVVLGNFDLTVKSATAKFAHTGEWFDYLNQTVYSVSDVSQNFDLQPGECRLFIDKKVEYPGFSVGIQQHDVNDLNDLNVNVYPNPVDDKLQIDAKQAIQLVEIVSMQGSVIMQQKGNVNMLNTTSLHSGVYTVRVVLSNGKVLTKLFVKQ